MFATGYDRVAFPPPQGPTRVWAICPIDGHHRDAVSEHASWPVSECWGPALASDATTLGRTVRACEGTNGSLGLDNAHGLTCRGQAAVALA